MKIINQFKKLLPESKIALRFRKNPTEIFCGTGKFDYGLEITLSTGRPVAKEYERFTLNTVESKNEKTVVIKSTVINEEELEVFGSLLEYVLFELAKKSRATPTDIKNYVDNWLSFSSGKKSEISIEKQVGLIGELLILRDLVKEFPRINHLNNWHGPGGSKIDFVFSERFGLEVKSRVQPFKDWISISSLEQLDNDLEGQHMVVCDFLPTDTGFTLREITDEVIVLLDDRDKANELIEKMRKIDFDYFRDYTYLIKVSPFKQTCFDTKSVGFPVLRKVIDLRIDKIKYDININGLETINFSDTISTIRNQLE